MLTGDRLFRLAVLLVLGLVLGIAATGTIAAERVRYERIAPAEKAFVDVVLDLEQAIGQHNFAITARNEIGDAIRRRGHPNFADATIVHFCNLEYARRVIDIDPNYLLYMPCRIAVFEQAQRVHVASLLLPLDTGAPGFNTLAETINRQIREIIDASTMPIVAPVARRAR
ncbi:lipoprotein [Salinisphaera shabanensis E1L3A]|mgnify:CR=1 FL=1|uniref:Lipoprotein n=1 Tax=Salinisphaera shabanensis E1L3A TaxID=1033802 RepID=F7QCH0_9GAMM|nr:DUF302 domain-containing protein [Salinisphaera shabanensis]ERJ18486.1 lipoprotein [Salinisphaera shabanensis E1L3A]